MVTDFLAARPSFLRGFARVLDLLGTPVLYNASATEREADMRALYSDWAITMADFQKAIDDVQSSIEAGDITIQPSLFDDAPEPGELPR